ncbi:AI-2E family transporter [Sediminicoccus sp. KRV36]|uniref:AI-2E family transporter n=1 Tax=Sediminicoccus sp. KRV36 TaxID=3133721 RepID=UPI00200EF1FE|nr:AI-2E family transporter [Sediminicoccus rosea]UPY38800.1 AI-2E family transporter [Sediminicoccus rosea]
MAPFRPPETAPSEGRAARLLLIAGVIIALYVGREIFAPLALALLLTIAALPAVGWMERLGLPRVPSVLLVLLLVVGVFGGLVSVVLTQALALATELPAYESVLRGKLQSISQGSGPLEGVVLLIRRLGTAMAAPGAAPAAMAVSVVGAERSALSTLLELAMVIIAPVAMLAITLLLMAFILLRREDVRNRFLRLAGLHEMHRTTGAMAEATARIGRFLLMQVAVNGLFGFSMGLGLWALGVPNAPLWGVMGFGLRFIPFLGAPLSLLFPLLLAFATTEGWWTVILVLALFAVVDVVITYVMEPWLYGASMGVTPLALLISSAFWAVLWGPVGLILAPAMTACLVIIGRHVPAFGFLDVMLSDAEPLPLPARFYQRILAEDARGAAALLGPAVARLGVQPALEQLAMPAIAQIGSDRPSESFGAALAIRASRALVRVLEPFADEPDGEADILVLPIAGALDRAAATLVVAALLEAGHAATLAPDKAPAPVVILLVAAATPPRHRLARALRDGRRLPGHMMTFAATAEAEHALAREALPLPALMGLQALIAEVDRQIEEAAESLG